MKTISQLVALIKSGNKFWCKRQRYQVRSVNFGTKKIVLSLVKSGEHFCINVGEIEELIKRHHIDSLDSGIIFMIGKFVTKELPLITQILVIIKSKAGMNDEYDEKLKLWLLTLDFKELQKIYKEIEECKYLCATLYEDGHCKIQCGRTFEEYHNKDVYDGGLCIAVLRPKGS
jgi:hypothetical protein